MLTSFNHHLVSSERAHLVIYPFGHSPWVVFDTVQWVGMWDYAHLPNSFGRPCQDALRLVRSSRIKRARGFAFIRALPLAAYNPALCYWISSDLHEFLSSVACRRWAFFQSVPVPDRAFAAVIRHFKILRQLQRIGRAGIFAQPAEHAPRRIIRKRGQHLSPRRVVAFPSHHDQVFRARQRAKVASDAERLSSLRVLV